MALQVLIPALFVVGAVGALAYGATKAAKYALSDDCMRNKLFDFTPEEMSEWIKDKLGPEMQKAYDGRGIMVLQAAAGETVPASVVADVQEDQQQLELMGMSKDEARELARVDGNRVYLVAEPWDPVAIAMYLYQQLAQATCRVVKMRNWSTNPEPEFPSMAAKCLYQMLYIVVKMDLYARTGSALYEVLPGDLMAIDAVCPQARNWESAGQTGAIEPAVPSPTIPVFPQPTIPGTLEPLDPLETQFNPIEPSIPAEPLPMPGPTPTAPVNPTPIQGTSVGASRLDFRRMARDANSGALHPAYILNGVAFM